MTVGEILPWALVAGAAYLGYEFVLKPNLANLQSTTATTTSATTTATLNTSPLTLGPGFTFPQPGSGVPSVQTCPAGMVLTATGPMQFSDMRTQLVSAAYPNAANLSDTEVIAAWTAKNGSWAIPC